MNGESGGLGDKTPSHRKETTGGAWGPASSESRGRTGSGGPTYSSITSINTSVRDNKNILEVRLEKQEGSTFNLSMVEIENLMKRLTIDASHLIGVSACPEGRPVVFITLHPSTDITRFMNKNESYIVKEGVRTTTIRPAGKKDTLVKITGLHPNTKDQAVVKYLSVHGTVSTKDRVIHHVFPGEPGSSVLAGKLNGNRSYVVEIKIPMGSYHIIDGEKVSVRYSGQEWTCARCHQLKRNCPGAAVARNCTADRVLLSAHMTEHWQKIGYKPETDSLNEVDDTLELSIQVGRKEKENLVIPESSLTSKYRSVIVKGFRTDTAMNTIKGVLSENGLPSEYKEEDLARNEKTGILTVNNLKPEECLSLIDKMHRKRFLNRQLFVTSVVEDSPVKVPPTSPNPSIEPHNATSSNQNLVDPVTGAMASLPIPTLNLGKPLTPRPDPKPDTSDEFEGFVFGLVSPGVQEKISHLEGLKRKSEGSPEAAELSRKEKKILREEEKRQKKLEKKQELKDSRKVQENPTS